MSWHKDTVQEIGKYCREKFGSNYVHIDTSDKSIDKSNRGNNALPDLQNSNTRNDNLYSPDIIIKNNENSITHIIEVVESSPGSPVSVLGVIFTADISISIMKKETTQDSEIKPKLIFIIQNPEDSFDRYYCSICEELHKNDNVAHMEWMKKEKSELNEVFKTTRVEQNRFQECPICGGTHYLTHKHYKWFNSRLKSDEDKEHVEKQNKWTRLFNKTLNNEFAVKNIENPIYCYRTNYKSFI
jgi:hypothetical protein